MTVGSMNKTNNVIANLMGYLGHIKEYMLMKFVKILFFSP